MHVVLRWVLRYLLGGIQSDWWRRPSCRIRWRSRLVGINLTWLLSLICSVLKTCRWFISRWIVFNWNRCCSLILLLNASWWCCVAIGSNRWLIIICLRLVLLVAMGYWLVIAGLVKIYLFFVWLWLNVWRISKLLMGRWLILTDRWLIFNLMQNWLILTYSMGWYILILIWWTIVKQLWTLFIITRLFFRRSNLSISIFILIPLCFRMRNAMLLYNLKTFHILGFQLLTFMILISLLFKKLIFLL